MKILALSDIHGSYSVARSIIEKERPDILVLAGDISTMGSVKELRSAIATFARTTNNIVAISGNTDYSWTDELLNEEKIGINSFGRIVENIGFFGVSGSPFSPMHTLYEISEEEIFRRAELGYRMIEQCEVKIFVSHAPPYHTNVDKLSNGLHAGSTSVRKFIDEFQPTLCICGHIHEARGNDKIGNTIILNCGKTNKYYGVITFGKIISVENKEV
ncbi:MAG: YfcE family phosphodiesterase [Ignavibacteria bacterium]|nr:YfcE family phosphodiesterase [Ignavibacteria bacterium]